MKTASFITFFILRPWTTNCRYFLTADGRLTAEQRSGMVSSSKVTGASAFTSRCLLRVNKAGPVSQLADKRRSKVECILKCSQLYLHESSSCCL